MFTPARGWYGPDQTPGMDFRLLGPLEVAEQDRLLALGGQKQRSLLAVLLLHANDVVSTERLIDEVWGESPRRRLPRAFRCTSRGCASSSARAGS